MQHRLISLRQSGNESVGPGQAGRRFAFFIGGIQSAVPDIFQHGSGKKVNILQNNSQTAPQIALFDLIDIDAVIPDFSVGNIVKPVDEVGNGGFAGTGSPDKGNFLARVRMNRNIEQHLFFRNIAEIHRIDLHLSAQRRIGQSSVGMGMFPGPGMGMLGRFFKGSVLPDFAVHQGDIAVVFFRFFIHQSKNPGSAGQPHYNGIDLLGKLIDIAGKLLGHIQKRNNDIHRKGQPGKAEVRHRRKQKHPTDRRADNIQNISDIHNHRRQAVGIGMGFIAVLAEFGVDAVKFFFGLFFMAEHLDHLLAVHHFLNEAFGFPEGTLLTDKEFGRSAAEFSRNEYHNPDTQKDDRRHPDAVVQHNGQNTDHNDERLQQLRQGTADEFPKGIDIVGIITHDIAEFMGVEIPDGQILHSGEHFLAQLIQKTLGNFGHQLGINRDEGHGRQVQPDQYADQRKNFPGGGPPIGISFGQIPGNDCQHLLGKDRRNGRYHRHQHDTDPRNGQ